MILVDTCILIDVINEDAEWCEPSCAALDEWGRRGPVLVNPIIYAEVSPGFEHPAALDEVLETVGVEFRELPREALFLAARAHRAYRHRGGLRIAVLPDFFIGAHALTLGVPVLTRDPTRYRAYFPTLRVAAP
ncbi:MAG: type II toxin-antitoxin system VapC family toxin [Myxococcota bacterium]